MTNLPESEMKKRRLHRMSEYKWCTSCDIGMEVPVPSNIDLMRGFTTTHATHLVQVYMGIEANVGCPHCVPANTVPLLLDRLSRIAEDRRTTWWMYKCQHCGFELEIAG